MKAYTEKRISFAHSTQVALILDKLGCIRQYAKIKSFYFCTLRSFAVILQKY